MSISVEANHSFFRGKKKVSWTFPYLNVAWGWVSGAGSGWFPLVSVSFPPFYDLLMVCSRGLSFSLLGFQSCPSRSPSLSETAARHSGSTLPHPASGKPMGNSTVVLIINGNKVSIYLFSHPHQSWIIQHPQCHMCLSRNLNLKPESLIQSKSSWILNTV